jgi:hypothetical protein
MRALVRTSLEWASYGSRSELRMVGVVALVLFSLPSFSQVNTGRISGVVTDQSGASSPEAR